MRTCFGANALTPPRNYPVSPIDRSIRDDHDADELETDGWLPDGWFREYRDIDVPGLKRFDPNAEDSEDNGDDAGGIVVESMDGDEPIMTRDTVATDLLADFR